jgi:hypothetical protein
MKLRDFSIYLGIDHESKGIRNVTFIRIDESVEQIHECAFSPLEYA